MTLSVTIPRA